MKKRVLSILIVFSLLTSFWSFLPVNAETYEGYTYTVNHQGISGDKHW